MNNYEKELQLAKLQCQWEISVLNNLLKCNLGKKATRNIHYKIGEAKSTLNACDKLIEWNKERMDYIYSLLAELDYQI